MLSFKRKSERSAVHATKHHAIKMNMKNGTLYTFTTTFIVNGLYFRALYMKINICSQLPLQDFPANSYLEHYTHLLKIMYVYF